MANCTHDSLVSSYAHLKFYTLKEKVLVPSACHEPGAPRVIFATGRPLVKSFAKQRFQWEPSDHRVKLSDVLES